MSRNEEEKIWAQLYTFGKVKVRENYGHITLVCEAWAGLNWLWIGRVADPCDIGNASLISF